MLRICRMVGPEIRVVWWCRGLPEDGTFNNSTLGSIAWYATASTIVETKGPCGAYFTSD